MALAFVPVERDQALLLRPDIRDWLPKNHLVWFVLDAVDEFDLSAFYARYRTGAQGRAAYDPRMMVALLLYAYATGIRSSRDIERRLHEDIAFRAIAVNRVVDHATICCFRRTHEDALSELFVQVVGLCVKAGMVRTMIVAIDGTKISANAAQARNYTDDQLKKLAAKVLEEAEAADTAEDELYGDGRGDEIPDELVDRSTRLEWLRQELAKRPEPRSGKDKKINATDPESRVMKTPDGYTQGYNAQLAASEDYVIVAADLTDETGDVAQLKPMIEQTESNLKEAGVGPAQTIVADAGYLSAGNAGLDTGAELLISPTTRRDLDDAIKDRGDTDPVADVKKRPRYPRRHTNERRLEVIEAYIAKLITAEEAASELFARIERIYIWAWQLRHRGYLDPVRNDRPPPSLSARDVMLERLADPEARDRYKKRGQIIEAVIGHIKELRGMRRFTHRGLAACRCELRMMAAAQNLRRNWTVANQP